MATPLSPTPAAESIAPHLCPLLHSFTTPDLARSLARSNLPNLTALLNPFQSSVHRVTVRSTSYEPRLLPTLSLQLVERQLPPGWDDALAGPATDTAGGRARSGSVRRDRANTGAAAGGLPRFPSALEPNPTQEPTPSTPTTPFAFPSQAERDELFLDSVASMIASRVDPWIAHSAAPELHVRGVTFKARLRDDEEDKGTQEEDNDKEEGWEGKSTDELTPWYAAMRDEVFKRREMVEWETFGWPVGCLLALSTSHPDPLNALSALWELTSRANLFSPASYPPRSGAEEDGRHEWANPDVLRYIVLVHDVGAGGGKEAWDDAQRLHETIRKTYGLHTALLPLFSASPTALQPSPPAQNLSSLFPSSSSSGPHPAPGRSAIGLGVDGYDVEEGVEKVEQPERVAMERGKELSEEDLRLIGGFMRELVVQSVVPWIERAVVVGNEQYTASKKSIGGRLFSAGRKYFGSSSSSGSRSGSPVSAQGASLAYNAIKGFYPYQAQESQTRRLADLAFMLGDYKLAASVYEQASRDYKGDKAWRYYSSACRMAGLSHLLAHPPEHPVPASPDAYLLAALQTPLPSASSIDLDGLRATMLYYEAYLSLGDCRFAPGMLVRAAGEADEVANAVLLEQAALADLKLGEGGRGRAHRRKYAVHMVMAAARYEKSGLKALSRRCLSQASTLYRVPPPSLPSPSSRSPSSPPTASLSLRDPRLPPTLTSFTAIRTHLHHNLARQSYNVGLAPQALAHFLQLLAGEPAGGDCGGREGQVEWLEDFGLAWEHLGERADEVVRERGLRLPVKLFEAKKAGVRVGGAGQEGESGGWEGLEGEMLRMGAWEGKRPARLEGRLEKGEAIVGETFYLELPVTNPLEAFLAIGGLSVATDAPAGELEIEAPQELELAPLESRTIYVPVRAATLGTFTFLSLSYRFNDLLPVTESLVLPVKPTALATPGKPASAAKSSALTVKLRAPIPVLSVELEGLPSRLFNGETRVAALAVRNTGQVPLVNLQALCSHPSFALFLPASSASTDDIYTPSASQDTPASCTIPNQISPNTPFPLLEPGEALQPGDVREVRVLCRGDAVGEHVLRCLFAFEGADGTPGTFTARALHHLEVYPSLEVRYHARPSNRPGSPFVLGVEAYNSGISSDVHLTQIALVSPRWRCALLEGSEFEEDVTAPLGWQQTGNFFLTVDAVDSEEGIEEGTEWSVKQVEGLLQGRKIEDSAPRSTALHLSTLAADGALDITSPSLFASLLATHTSQRLSTLSSQLPVLPASLLPSLFPLFPSRSASLLLFFRSTSPVLTAPLSGHLLLPLPPLGAGSSAALKSVLETAELKAGGLYEESQRERTAMIAALRRSELGVEDNPVAVAVEVDEVRTHDFDRGPCTLPVTFNLRNLSPTTSFDYTFAMGTSQASQPNVVYSGLLTRKGTLAPLALARITTRVWISREGVFNVGDWRLSATTAEGASWSRQGFRRDVRVRNTSAASQSQRAIELTRGADDAPLVSVVA
ncbi:hypothetical protein JCM1840_005328 [Sporobolomyces johnsonii]